MREAGWGGSNNYRLLLLWRCRRQERRSKNFTAFTPGPRVGGCSQDICNEKDKDNDKDEEKHNDKDSADASRGGTKTLLRLHLDLV